MGTTKDLSERSLRAIRPYLEDGEKEIARGRCHYSPAVERERTHTFLLVTDRRLFWTDFGGFSTRVNILGFSDVDSLSEGPRKHRWILLLRHGPAIRMEPISPKWYRPTSWHMPPTEGRVERTETVLEFSRRETLAALAITSKLDELRVARRAPLKFAERPREERGLLVARRETSWRRRRWFHRRRSR